MTEKLFVKLAVVGIIRLYTTYNEYKDYEGDEVLNLINSQHETIQQLQQAYTDAKSDVERYEQILKDIMGDNLLIQDMKNNIRIYEKENEQLKRQIGNLEHTKDFCADVCADCERLEKENEQLKSILKEMVRVSEYNGAISPTRVKCMAYNFIEGLK